MTPPRWGGHQAHHSQQGSPTGNTTTFHRTSPVAKAIDTGEHVGHDTVLPWCDAPPAPWDAPPTHRNPAVNAAPGVVRVTILLAAILGVLAGPWLRGLVFAHTVAWRQPLRHRCPVCHTPVVSTAGYGLLAVAPHNGHCPTCASPIGPVAGSVEILSSLALMAAAARAPSGWVLAAWTWWVLLGIALSLIDTTVHRLPDALTTATTVGVGLLLTAQAVTSGETRPLLRALTGAAGLGAVHLIAILAPTGLGRGDGHLAVSIGLLLGWISIPTIVLGTILAVVLAAAWTAHGRIRGRLGGSDQVALGPHLITGAFLALLAST